MMDAVHFWLAKELVELGCFLGILLFGGTIALLSRSAGRKR